MSYFPAFHNESICFVGSADKGCDFATKKTGKVCSFAWKKIT